MVVMALQIENKEQRSYKGSRIVPQSATGSGSGITTQYIILYHIKALMNNYSIIQIYMIVEI